MKHYEVLDNLINTFSILRKETIDNSYGGFIDPYFSFQKNVVHKKFIALHGDIERDILISAVNKLESDRIIDIPKRNAVPFLIIFNHSFFEALETENGWYKSKHFTKQMELELLATRLEKLTLELNKLENDSSIFKEHIPSLAATTATIASTLDIISKIQ